MNEPIDGESIPPTPDRAPSPPIRRDPDGFTTMIEDVKDQIGKIQADFIRLQNQNMRLEEALAQSNRTINTINGELRAEKERIVRLTQRLAASEEANRLSQERLQQVRAEMERTTTKIQQRQEETTATLQRVDQHVDAVEATAVDARKVASRAGEFATKIATNSEGFFAKTDRNEARLNRLQQALSSADTLQTGTKKVPLYHDLERQIYINIGHPVDREEPDSLPANVLTGLKELGRSLTP